MSTGPAAVKSLPVPPAMSTTTSGKRTEAGSKSTPNSGSTAHLSGSSRAYNAFARLKVICQCARAARHHHDASSIKLITLAAALDPVERRDLVHSHRELNIHRRLVCGRCSNPQAIEKPSFMAPDERSEIPDRLTGLLPVFVSLKPCCAAQAQVSQPGPFGDGLDRCRQTSRQLNGCAANSRFTGKLTRRSQSPIISLVLL
jgi:hypothetical protein